MSTIGCPKTVSLLPEKITWKIVAIGELFVIIFTVNFLPNNLVNIKIQKNDYDSGTCNTQLGNLPHPFQPQKNMSRFNKQSLENIQSQTNINQIRKIQTNWLTPPSTLPYNITPDTASDLSAVKRLHKLVLKLFAEKKNGFFIECGAFDGVSLSNTLHLEQKYNWTGLLVEADPKYYAQLAQKQRKAWTINACLAIHPYEHQVEMTRIKDQGALSRITEIASKKFLSEPQAENFKAHCFPLAMILSSIGQTLNIDYFSLDIENAELKVLKTIPWDFVYIKVISLEAEHDTFGAINEFLTTKNYKFLKEVRGPWIHDYVFIHNQFDNL